MGRRAWLAATVLVGAVLLNAASGLAAAAADSSRLTWSPAAAGVGDYQSYRVVDIRPGVRNYSGAGRDIWLRLPTDAAWEGDAGGIQITNARNVVLIGGEVHLRDSIPFQESPRRSIYFKNITGTAFVEGLYIHGDGCGDIFTIASPEATFYFQNIRAEISHDIKPSDPVHADLIQPWGGHKGIYIDRFTGLSTYQGLQINRDLADVGPVYIRRTNLRSNLGGGHYLLWLNKKMSPVYIDGATFWIEPAPQRAFPRLLNTIWPKEGLSYHSDEVGNYVTSALRGVNDQLVLQNWTGDGPGRVYEGVPPTGDYVPAGAVGIGYVSPGYIN